MLEHHHEVLTTHTKEGLLDVAILRESLSVAVIIHTGNEDAVVAATDGESLVDQQVPPQLPIHSCANIHRVVFLVLIAFEVDGVVVIANHGVDTVLGLDALQEFLNGQYLTGNLVL